MKFITLKIINYKLYLNIIILISLILIFIYFLILISTKYYRSITVIEKSNLNIYNHIYYQNDIEVIRQNKEYFKFILLKDIKLYVKEDINIYASGINNQIYIESQALSPERAIYISNKVSNILYNYYLHEFNKRSIEYYDNYFFKSIKIQNLEKSIKYLNKLKTLNCISKEFCKYNYNIKKFEDDLLVYKKNLKTLQLNFYEPIIFNKNTRLVYIDQNINSELYLFLALIFVLIFYLCINYSHKKFIKIFKI